MEGDGYGSDSKIDVYYDGSRSAVEKVVRSSQVVGQNETVPQESQLARYEAMAGSERDMMTAC